MYEHAHPRRHYRHPCFAALITLMALGCRATPAPSDASVPLGNGGGLQAAVDADGLSLAVADETLVVCAVAWGRDGGERSGLSPTPITPSACAPWSDATPCTSAARSDLVPDQLVAWVQGTASGPQQGWEVLAPPPGAGVLAMDLAVEGVLASLRVVPHSVTMRTPGGAAIRVGGLKAWDATGRVVPAWFEKRVEGFRLMVDDGGATYPLIIDPVYTSMITEVTNTGTEWVYLGDAVAGVGDANSDGYDDVAVASHKDNRAWLYLGAAGGLDTGPYTDLAVPSSTSGVKFGRQAIGADVDGDGDKDVIVLEYGKYDRAVVYDGSSFGVSSSASTTLTLGSVPYDAASLGDVNKDGYEDVAFALCDEGAVEVAYSSEDGLGGTTPSSVLEVLGGTGKCDVDATGDLNGDGCNDLIAGQEDGGDRSGLVVLVMSGGEDCSIDDVTTMELTEMMTETTSAPPSPGSETSMEMASRTSRWGAQGPATMSASWTSTWGPGTAWTRRRP